MILVLTGQNDFARMEEVKRIANEFTKEFGDFGLEKIDAAEIDYNKLLDSVSVMPFLSEKRMVVLSNISSNKLLSENITRFIEQVSDTTELIINESKFDKRSSLYKALKKQIGIKEFAELDERGITNWLVKAAKERGAILSLADARLIISRAGLGQMMLSNELDKLISYSPTITKESIEELVYPLPSSSIFELVDAAFSGNKKKAIDLYQDQRTQLVEPQAIMGMIGWQLHVIAIVKFNETRTVEEVASLSKLNPFVVKKSRNLVSNLTLNQVKDLISRAVKLDSELKSLPVESDEAIQNFILTI